jgi:hypothetical protein
MKKISKKVIFYCLKIFIYSCTNNRVDKMIKTVRYTQN